MSFEGYYTLDLDVLLDYNAAVARVEYSGYQNNAEVAATGSSKRARGDKNVPGVAEDLAVARALRNLALKLENRAQKVMDKVNPDPEPIGFSDAWDALYDVNKGLITSGEFNKWITTGRRA